MEINSEQQEIGKMFLPRKPQMYDQLKKLNPEHELVVEYDEALEAYARNWNKFVEEGQKKVEESKPVLPELAPMKFESLYEVFKLQFYANEGVEFDGTANNGEAELFVMTLIAYFLQRGNFKRSPLIYKEKKDSIVSFDKGLLIIGGYGCGKTSIIKAFHKLFNNAFTMPVYVKDKNENTQPLRRYKLHFGFITTNKLVSDYEVLNNEAEREVFWTRHLNFPKYFDDLMTERKANNYGKVDLMKDILEERYSKKALTMASCNFAEENNTVKGTLEAIADRYGERVYDRLYSMFNIVVLNGRSLRK